MDFTTLDFVYMIPKLLIRIREHVLNAASPTGKARASGYNHTHADCDGIDISLLSIFPSDEEINLFAIQAFEEAQNLLATTGIIPSTARSHNVLPDISTWFSNSGRKASDDEADTLEGNGDLNDDGHTSDGEEQEDVSKLLDCVEHEAYGGLPHSAVEEIKGLGYAAIMSSVGDSMFM